MQRTGHKKRRFLFSMFPGLLILFFSSSVQTIFAQTATTLPTQIEVGTTPSDITIAHGLSNILGIADFNGDQIDDLLLAYYRNSETGSYIEKFGIISGKRNTGSMTNLDLASVSPDITINFVRATGRTYVPIVNLIGDVNGDHIDDLLFQEGLGNPANGGGYQYIFFGSTNWRSGLIELSLPDADIKMFYPYSRNVGGIIGMADINGDGIKDMILAGYGGIARVNVLLGPFSSRENIDFRERTPDAVFINPNKKEFDRRLSFADMNGDGIADILAQSYIYTDEGKVYLNSVKIIFGSADLKDGIEKSFLDDEVDVNIDAGTGYLISATADVNKDGSDDIVLAYPNSVGQGVSPSWVSGKVEIVFGSPSIRGKLTPKTASIVGLPQPLEFNPPPNQQFGDGLGQAVKVQDINGDGIADILLGAPGTTANLQGQVKRLNRAYVILGSTELNNRTKIETALMQQDITFTPLSIQYALGSYINSGDFNGDGIADIFLTTIIYKKNASTSVTTFIYFGGQLRRPEIREASYKKGSAELLIFGKEFTGAAQIEINGKLIRRPISFDLEKNQLVIQGSKTELNLISGKNHLVVIRRDSRSDSFTFKVKGE